MGRTNWGREPTTREHEVREILAAGEHEGLSVREMAARAGIAPGTLSWWRVELRRRERLRGAAPESSPVASASFVEVVAAPIEDAADARPRAAPAEPAATPFEIELHGGRRVRVPVSFGLARLVRELEGC